MAGILTASSLRGNVLYGKELNKSNSNSNDSKNRNRKTAHFILIIFPEGTDASVLIMRISACLLIMKEKLL